MLNTSSRVTIKYLTVWIVGLSRCNDNFVSPLRQFAYKVIDKESFRPEILRYD